MPIDDDDDDRPARRPRRDDDEDDRPVRRPKNSRGDDDDDRPVRRPRRDDDDDDDAPRRSGGKPHRGTMILIFGILGWLCCPIFAILAVIMGGADLKQMDAGQMDSSGRGMTKAGQIIGIIALCLFVVGVIIQIALMAMHK